MTLYKRREMFSDLSIKIGLAFSKLRISPNQWTLISIIPVLAALYFLVNQQFFLAAGLFLLSAFLDLVDGSVARVTGRVSRLGAYLDTVVDRYVEAIIVLGLILIPLPDVLFPMEGWILAYLFGGMMTTYVKAAAKEKNLVVSEIKGGLLERAERLLILLIGIIAAPFSLVYLSYVIVLLAILTNISALQRIWIAVNS